MSPPVGVDWGVWIGGAIAISVALIGGMWKLANWKGGLDQWKKGVDEWKNDVKIILKDLQEAVSVIKEDVVSIKAAYEKDMMITTKGKKGMVQRRSPLVPSKKAIEILEELNILSQVDANIPYIQEEIEKRSQTSIYRDIEDPEERFIEAAPGVIHALIKKGKIEEKKIDEALDRLEEVFPGVSYYGVLLLIAAYILEKGREKGFIAKPSMIYSQIDMAGSKNRDELLASFGGDAEKAIKSLEMSIRTLKGIGKKKELAENKFMLALIYEYIKRRDEAEKEYREAIEINHDYAVAHNNLGYLLYNLKRFEEAEKEYIDALELKDNLPDKGVLAHNNLGILLSDLKRFEEAEKEYRDAIRLNPDDSKAHNNLGALLYNLKQFEEAEKECREAIRLNPDFVEAYNNLGALLSDLKRFEEAEKEYREAIRLNPDFALAHYNLGLLFANLKRFEEAEKECREAIRLNPDFAEAHVNLGFLYSILEKTEEAKKELEIAKRLFEAQGREEDVKKVEELLNSLK